MSEQSAGQPAAATATDPGASEQPRVVRALNNEHRYMANLLGVLREQVAVIEAGGEPDFNVVLDIVHYMKNFPDRYHHPREDVLYAHLGERDPGVGAVLQSLQREHVELEELADRLCGVLEELSAGRDGERRHTAIDLTNDYIDRLSAHMDKEEAGVLPRAAQVLDAEDFYRIDQESARFEQVPTVEILGDRFGALRQYITCRLGKAFDDAVLAEYVGVRTAAEMLGHVAGAVVGTGCGLLARLLPGQAPADREPLPESASVGDIARRNWTSFRAASHLFSPDGAAETDRR